MASTALHKGFVGVQFFNSDDGDQSGDGGDVLDDVLGNFADFVKYSNWHFAC